MQNENKIYEKWHRAYKREIIYKNKLKEIKQIAENVLYDDRISCFKKIKTILEIIEN